GIRKRLREGIRRRETANETSAHAEISDIEEHRLLSALESKMKQPPAFTREIARRHERLAPIVRNEGEKAVIGEQRVAAEVNPRMQLPQQSAREQAHVDVRRGAASSGGHRSVW